MLGARPDPEPLFLFIYVTELLRRMGLTQFAVLAGHVQVTACAPLDAPADLMVVTRAVRQL
jgi:hypothetical protein